MNHKPLIVYFVVLIHLNQALHREDE